MGSLIVQAVIIDHVFGITHNFKHQQVAGMADHKGALFSQGGVEALVQAEAVLVHKFIFHRAERELGEVVLFCKTSQDIRFDPHKITPHIGRAHLQRGHRAVVRQPLDLVSLGDLKIGGDESRFDFWASRWVEQGNL